jgi:septal ring factor EnvC (AmiA/AmiB activator)
MKKFVLALALTAAMPAAAQDIRGLEVCSAEKQMERRTGCLQANTEFLQQALAKHTREAAAKFAAGERELAAAKAEIAALKAQLSRLDRELAQLRVKADGKAEGKK